MPAAKPRFGPAEVAAPHFDAPGAGALGPLPGSVAIVGNAPGRQLGFEAIDEAGWVVRFNNAPGFGSESGSRVTHLVLVNHGGQMREWLDDPGFTGRPVVRQACTILFPFAEKASPGEGDGADWTSQARRRLAPLGKPVVVLPQWVRDEAQAVLAQGGAAGAAPSTGFLAAVFLVSLLGPNKIPCTVHGFGFEGWSGHAWSVERGWFEANAAAGRLRLAALRP